MPSFNQVLLMGNITRDPQIKTLPNGSQVADFGLAINRKFRTAQGEDKEEVCYVDCSAFGKQAEVIAQYCTKGKPLFVDGRLKYDTWEGKDGTKRSKLSVTVENFQFIGGKNDGGGDNDGGGFGQQQQRPAPPARGQTPREKIQNRPAPASPFGDDPEFQPADIPF